MATHDPSTRVSPPPIATAAAASAARTSPTTVTRLTGVACAAGATCLVAALVIAPAPDPANARLALWAPAQALHVVAFVLLVLGLPGVATSLGARLGVAGVIGYVALMTRFVLSAGSHVYLLWIVPQLERHRDALGSTLSDGGSLQKYYGTHGGPINLVLGVGMLGLAFALVCCGRGCRAVGVVLALGALGEALGIAPVALFADAVVLAWLGLRLALRGAVVAPLRPR